MSFINNDLFAHSERYERVVNVNEFSVIILVLGMDIRIFLNFIKIKKTFFITLCKFEFQNVHLT